MQINVNGERVTVSVRNLTDVLETLGYECKYIVVAVNATFVPKHTWKNHALAEGDDVEVLASIEGG